MLYLNTSPYFYVATKGTKRSKNYFYRELIIIIIDFYISTLRMKASAHCLDLHIEFECRRKTFFSHVWNLFKFAIYYPVRSKVASWEENFNLIQTSRVHILCKNYRNKFNFPEIIALTNIYCNKARTIYFSAGLLNVLM